MSVLFRSILGTPALATLYVSSAEGRIGSAQPTMAVVV